MKYLRNLMVICLGFFLAGARTHNPGNPVEGRNRNGSVDDVDSPADISKAGWKAVFKRTGQALKDKNLSMLAAGLAYYSTLTFFPAALGLATVFTAVAGPQALLDLLKSLELVIPPALQDLLQTQLSPLARAQPASLGIASLVSLGAVLWTTSGGIQNLVKATNVAYEVSETRGMFKLRLLSIGLSAVFITFAAVVLILLIMQGDALHALGMPTAVSDLFPILRWPLLVVVLSIALSIIYRYAPDRINPKWSWVSWGASAAVVIWLIGTILFFVYAQNFGNFNKSYGTFASIIILMVWFNLTSLIVLVGAQVNKKLEEVTDADTADRN
jgi:membrane protein